MKPFFHSIERVQELVAESRSWLRTPFRAHCAVKGVGTDCVGFCHAVFVKVGAVEPIRFPAYALDEGSHSNRSKLAGVLGGSGRFTEIWTRQQPGEELAVPLAIGDLLGFHLGRSVHHIGIFIGPRHFIHSLEGYGVVESMVDDPTYKRVLVSVWRCVEVNR